MKISMPASGFDTWSRRVVWLVYKIKIKLFSGFGLGPGEGLPKPVDSREPGLPPCNSRVRRLTNVAPQAGQRARIIFTCRLRLLGRDCGRARPRGRFYTRPLGRAGAPLWPVGTWCIYGLGGFLVRWSPCGDLPTGLNQYSVTKKR